VAFILVLGGSAEAEVRSFEQQARSARPIPCSRLEREPDGIGASTRYLPDCFGSGDEIGRRNYLMDECPVRWAPRAHHVSGEDELPPHGPADHRG